MGVEHDLISPCTIHVVAFNGSLVYPIGTIILPIYIVDMIIHVNFLIIDIPYMNVIMEREWIHAVKGIVSTRHQVMRCQPLNELYTIDFKGDHTQHIRCYFIIHEEGMHKPNKDQIRKLEKSKAKKKVEAYAIVGSEE